MKKIIVIVALAFMGSMSVLAHAGHEHEDTTLLDINEHKGSEYSISKDDEDLGHFVIKSVKKTKDGSAVKIRQTFHLDSEIEKTVTANYGEDKILSYSFPAGDENYFIFIDFQNLDSGDNSGIRLVYAEEPDGREIVTEEIVVTKVTE